MDGWRIPEKLFSLRWQLHLCKCFGVGFGNNCDISFIKKIEYWEKKVWHINVRHALRSLQTSQFLCKQSLIVLKWERNRYAILGTLLHRCSLPEVWKCLPNLINPFFNGIHHNSGCIADIHFFLDFFPVTFNGADTELESFGNFFVG